MCGYPDKGDNDDEIIIIIIIIIIISEIIAVRDQGLQTKFYATKYYKRKQLENANSVSNLIRQCNTSYQHSQCRKRTIHKVCAQLHFNIITIGIQPLGRSGQRPEFSQATGMILVRCILGKFFGEVCHCFPPRLDVPTLATRCLHVRHDVKDPSGGSGNCGRECCPVILPK